MEKIDYPHQSPDYGELLIEDGKPIPKEAIEILHKYIQNSIEE
jgi:hypothetical protein